MHNFFQMVLNFFQFKVVSHMTGNLGRKSRFSALVVTGNQKGLIGMLVTSKIDLLDR